MQIVNLDLEYLKQFKDMPVDDLFQVVFFLSNVDPKELESHTLKTFAIIKLWKKDYQEPWPKTCTLKKWEKETLDNLAFVINHFFNKKA